MIQAIVFFVVGLLGVWLVGAVTRVTATYLVKDEIAPIAGFSLAIGFVLAGGFIGVETGNDLEKAALNVGMIGGLAILWFRYFKREKANG